MELLGKSKEELREYCVALESQRFAGRRFIMRCTLKEDFM